MLPNAGGCTSAQVRDLGIMKIIIFMHVQYKGELSPVDPDASGGSKVVNFQFSVALTSVSIKRRMECKHVYSLVAWFSVGIFFVLCSIKYLT